MDFREFNSKMLKSWWTSEASLSFNLLLLHLLFALCLLTSSSFHPLFLLCFLTFSFPSLSPCFLLIYLISLFLTASFYVLIFYLFYFLRTSFVCLLLYSFLFFPASSFHSCYHFLLYLPVYFLSPITASPRPTLLCCDWLVLLACSEHEKVCV